MTIEAPAEPRTIREVVGLFDTYPARWSGLLTNC